MMFADMLEFCLRARVGCEKKIISFNVRNDRLKKFTRKIVGSFLRKNHQWKNISTSVNRPLYSHSIIASASRAKYL